MPSNPTSATPTIGRVVRTLEQSPRVARERYWIWRDPSSGLVEPVDWEADNVVEERSFEVPVTGPLLIWDESVGPADDLSRVLSEVFAGNLEIWEPEPEAVHIDVRSLEPVSDDEFWPVIEQLGGRLWERTLNTATRTLAASDEDFVLRWHETIALKAVELVEAFSRAGYADQVRGFEGLYVAGSSIGKGQAAFTSVLADPAAWNSSWVTDSATSVLFLGAMAMERKHGRVVDVRTSFTETHQRMLDEFESDSSEAEAEFDAGSGLDRQQVLEALGSSPSDEQIVELLQTADLSREGMDALHEALVDPGASWPRARHERGSSLRASRSLVKVGDHLHVRIILGDAHDAETDPRRATALDIESFGGEVVGPVELSPRVFASLMNTEIFAIKRRFAGSREEYLHRYVRR